MAIKYPLDVILYRSKEGVHGTMSCFTPKNAALTYRNHLGNEWNGCVIHYNWGPPQGLKPKYANIGTSFHAIIGACELSHVFHYIYAKHPLKNHTTKIRDSDSFDVQLFIEYKLFV